MTKYMVHGDSESYREFTIRVESDYNPMNPHTDWDCTTPMLVGYGRHNERDYSGQDDLRNPFAYITPWQCSRHFRELCEIIGIDPDRADSYCRKFAAYYSGLSNARRDYLAESLREIGNKCDEYAALAELWRFAGCAAIDSSISGYSQGDYADVLAVQTPQWREKVGAPKPDERSIERQSADIESDIETYQAYAFGDVYGYVIEDSDGEAVDSCFGFYGMDCDKSGLWDEATNTVDYHIAQRREKRFARIKDLIRNRVPLGLRENDLQAI